MGVEGMNACTTRFLRPGCLALTGFDRIPEILLDNPQFRRLCCANTWEGSHEAIAERGAQAVIPSRKNAKPWSPTSAGALARNETLQACRHLGRAIWRRWSGYHRRSRVETKMHCIKLLGQRLTARDFDRQITEVHIRVAILNRFTALGTPITQALA